MNAYEKSAIVMITLGDERAAAVFKHLNTHEVTEISSAMAKMSSYTYEQLSQVMSEFHRDAGEYATLNINTNEYLRNVLVRALGEERAASLLEDLLDTQSSNDGIETLNDMEPQSVCDLIRDEHPQIIATILVHLKRSQA
ncbi:flagellar motor switch protein FliG, partial [Salmonella enterica subsp. enterica serovar Typhimurium]|nr:flagellar motor switch protein FliG [Salmonella enterica subsp. enterica serovar Typhimurium]